MFESEGLAVSIPAEELAAVQLTASLFTMDRLLTSDISPELLSALSQIEALRHGPLTNLVFIARPEIFTDGATLQWLHGRLGPIRDHLCLSDGSTIRLISGMRNHVFFYGLGRSADFDALTRLERRVPELFSMLSSQINTALRVRHRKAVYSPRTLILHRRSVNNFAAPELFRFYLNRHSSEDSVSCMLSNGPVALTETHLGRMIYIPLTETAAADRGFMRQVSGRIERSFFDPHTSIILTLAQGGGANRAIENRLQSLVDGLQSVLNQIPRVMADHILVAHVDVDPEQLRQRAGRLDLVVHDTFDFWRWTSATYALFDRVTVHVQRGRHHAMALSSMLEQTYGRKAEMVRPCLPGI